jgi:ankyrin repeat protein
LTPLQTACKYGADDVAFLLLSKTDVEKLITPNRPEERRDMAFHLVCRNKVQKEFLLKAILEKIANFTPTTGEETEKISKKYLEMALVREDSARQTLLHIAIENNHINIIELLLRDYAVDRELKEGKQGNMAIHVAAKFGSIEVFNILQKYDAISFKSNNNGENALHIAARNNKSTFIKHFLDHETNLMNKIKENEDNLLTNVNMKDDTKVLTSLITTATNCMCNCSHTPALYAINNQHYTPLMSAIVAGNEMCVEELAANIYCQLDAKDIDGNSIYHLCAEYDNIEALRFLLINMTKTYTTLCSVNNLDETVIHKACRVGNLEIIKIVINKLADFNSVISLDSFFFIKNVDSQSCFHIACIKG